MKVQPTSPRVRPWAIVLAGGDGTRLRPLVDRLYGDGRPKQFASLTGTRSLLRTTLDRVGRIAPVERTVVVTVARHRALVSGEIGDRGYRILEQPVNRGTAAAILWSAMWVAGREPDATLVILPADHHVSNEPALADHILDLTILAQSDPDRIFLLGARPTRPDTGYGWIELGAVMRRAGSRPVHAVRRFVEKPSEQVAEAMLRSGSLWSTLILVGRVRAFLAAGRASLPRVHAMLEDAARVADSPHAAAALHRSYAEIGGADFSRDLLELIPERLGVSVLSDSEWSDLGTPERVLAVVRATRLEPVLKAGLERIAERAAVDLDAGLGDRNDHPSCEQRVLLRVCNRKISASPLGLDPEGRPFFLRATHDDLGTKHLGDLK